MGTDSGAVRCLYDCIAGALIYHNIRLKETLAILKYSGLVAGVLLLITAGASAFSSILASTGAPTQLAAEVLSTTDSPIWVMLLFNVIMLEIGRASCRERG